MRKISIKNIGLMHNIFLIIVAVCLLSSLIGILSACNYSIQSIDFENDGQKIDSIDVCLDADPFYIDVQIQKNLPKKKQASIVWSIEGETHGASISQDGLFTVGNEIGSVVVKVEAKYKRKSNAAKLTVNIIDRQLQSIEIGGDVCKNYIEGQTFNPQGMVVTAVYGNSRKTVSDFSFDNSPLGADVTDVTISYTENRQTVTQNVPITVTPRKLQSIRVDNLPNKTQYIEGQYFDAEGLALTAVYEYMTLPIDDFDFDLKSELKIDDECVEVSYEENGVVRTAEIQIDVIKNMLSHIVISSLPNKTEYSSGELLNTTGLIVTAHYTNGKQSVVSGWYVNKTAPLDVEDNLIVVTYSEGDLGTKTAKFEISVKARTLQSISVTSMPRKTEYVEGEYFSTDWLKITALYEGGSYQDVDDYSLSVYNRTLNLEDSTVRVEYTENGTTVSTTFDITVVPRVLTGLELAALPNKVSYKTYETFNSRGLAIRAIYNNGLFTKLVSNYLLDKSNQKLTTEDTFITVIYTERNITETTSIYITVEPRTLASISITKSALKTTYFAGEYFDVLGLEITAHYADSDDAVIYDWSIDKTTALNLSDNKITVLYSEGDVTKTIDFSITVKEKEITDTNVQKVIDTINALPNTDILNLSHLDAVNYALSLYNELTQTQKKSVVNYSILSEDIIKIERLTEEYLESETEYRISYEIADGLSFSDFDAGSNLVLYKTSIGKHKLIDPMSQEAAELGFKFVCWLDSDTMQSVEYIEDVSADKQYLAKYKLTDTVVLRFFDYYNQKVELISPCTANRRMSDGKYLSDLNSSEIAEQLCAQKHLFVLSYYFKDQSNTIIRSESGIIPTNYNSEISVFCIVKEICDINIPSFNDGEISWTYSISDNDGNNYVIHKNRYRTERYQVPIGAAVIIYATNPLIKDIKINDVKVGLVYPATQYSFNLSEEMPQITLTFEYYLSDTVNISFSGINSKTYAFDKKNWDGKLTSNNLKDIAFIFDEENEKYLNRYYIADELYYFDDLENMIFEKDTEFNVVRITNSFVISIQYSGGNFVVENLIGKQSVRSAIENSNNALCYAMLVNLSLFEDIDRTVPVDFQTLSDSMLLSDINLYVAERQEFNVTAYLSDVDYKEICVPSYNEVSDFKLSDMLEEPRKSGSVFIGWSLNNNGNVLSSNYINLIVQNLNKDTALFAIWENIPENKIEVTAIKDANNVHIQLFDKNLIIRDAFDTDMYFICHENTVLSDQVILGDIAEYKRLTLYLYQKELCWNGELRFIELDTNGGNLDAQLPNYIALSNNVIGAFGDYSLDEIVPYKQSYVFVGWYTSKTGGDKIESFSDMRNHSEQVLYARYMAQTEFNYSDESFVGIWETSYTNIYGLIYARLEMFDNGNYDYQTFVNGTLSAHIFGLYLYDDSAIQILTVSMQNGANLIKQTDFKIESTFAEENMLIVTMFFLQENRVEFYEHLLVKDNVVPVNYNNTDVCGIYELIQVETIGDLQKLNKNVIELFPNGTAEVSVTMMSNDEVTYSNVDKCFYRILSDGTILSLSNGILGIRDITELLSNYAKKDEIINVQAKGVYTAVDYNSSCFAELIELTDEGMIIIHQGTCTYGASINIINLFEYKAFVTVGESSYLLDINFDDADNSLQVVVTGLSDQNKQILTYKTV